MRPTKQSDIISVNKWLARRGSLQVLELPSVGAIVPGVAAAFVRRGEGFNLLDSIVTNNLCSSNTRNSALDKLFKWATDNYSGLVGLTVEQSIALRAAKHGFKFQPHVVLVRK